MTEVVRSTCPGCQKTLNIPADWAGRTVKCKHCGYAMLVQAKVPSTAMATAIVSAAPMAMPISAPSPAWEPLPENGQLPDYMPPVATAPMPSAPVAPTTNSRYVSAFDTSSRYKGRGSYSGPKKGQWVKSAVVGAVIAILLGGVGIGGYSAIKASRSKPTDPTQINNGNSGTQSGQAGTSGEPGATGAFPRRMLAISIHSYLYANPLHNGDSGFALDDNRRTGTDAAIRKLAERWRVPKDQLYHLTDARQAGDKKDDTKKPVKGVKDEEGEMPKKVEMKDVAPRRASRSLPLKMVIEGTVTQLLDTSRAQDRIVLMFCGHALEKKGEFYLVPLEGDFDELESLIPLKWLYEKLGACKAQEKVVIFDVCRFNPEAGIQRPHPGSMSEAMEKALHESPEGVSVITTCSKGEQSIEADYTHVAAINAGTAGNKSNGFDVQGGYFLSMIHVASSVGTLSPDKKIPIPTDPLPVERFTSWMSDRLAETVKFYVTGASQTLKATLKPPTSTVAYSAEEALPARFEFPTPPPSADPKAVLAMLREVQLPAVKSFSDDAPPPAISDILPFSNESLKDYLAGELKLGDKPNDFQQAILDAVEEMRKLRSSGSLPERFEGETNDRAKAELRRAQEVPARVEATLQDHLDKLEPMADQKEKQVKRWQVHYDYVVAQLKLRVCYVNQYNLALANVRGGKLPDLKEGQTGYRLSAETTLDKNTQANYKEMFNDARKALTDIAKNNPNTPWALLAKGDRTVAIGLRLTGSSGSGK